MSVGVLAWGAVSALGRGSDAVVAAHADGGCRRGWAPDPAWAKAGLRSALSARVGSDSPPDVDRAEALLRVALQDLVEGLDGALETWRDLRIGLAIGTSSGAMETAESYFARRFRGASMEPKLARGATYAAPLRCIDEALAGATVTRRVQLLSACASSTMCLGLGLRWIERDHCDLVIAGGYDALTLFVAAGFDALRATTPSTPRPFGQDRDGMVLGEGAGLVALVGKARLRTRAFGWIHGFGASADANHITAPDREGAGLLRAATAALSEAGGDEGANTLGFVSVHATATPYNDASEAAALRALAPRRPVHPFKAQVGHCLGAAGVLEALSAWHHLGAGELPPAPGGYAVDPALIDAVELPAERRTSPAPRALKLSAAFGGVTAALSLGRDPAPVRPVRERPVTLEGFARVGHGDRRAVNQATGLSGPKLARLDEVSLLALTAVSSLGALLGRESFTGAGVVVGEALATLAVNEGYYRRLLEKGPRWVDPRVFPATSPNAAGGHVAIGFGLIGPNMTVGGGLGAGLESLRLAVDLLGTDADRMVVVAVDDPRHRTWVADAEVARPFEGGAVAALLAVDEGGRTVAKVRPTRQPQRDGWLLRSDERTPLTEAITVDHHRGSIGHLALWSWLVAQVQRGRARRPPSASSARI